MQAVIGDDPLDTAQTDLEVGLAQFLSDDLGGGIRIQKAIAQDLADGLIGAAVVGLGAGLLRSEGGQAALLEGVEDLIVALTAVAVFLGDGGDIVIQTLAFNEHEETGSQRVRAGDGQGAGGTRQLVSFRIELEKGIHGGSLRETGGVRLVDCGTILDTYTSLV